MLKTAEKKLYEGMFLVDSGVASDDWDAMIQTVQNLLTRYGAEIESIKKWDSRRLAYKIRGKTHGTYILTYFRIDGTKISAIERDVQLSEDIMRALILRTDRMSEEDIQKQTPFDKSEEREREIAEKAARHKAKSSRTAKESADENEETKLEAIVQDKAKTDQSNKPDESEDNNKSEADISEENNE